MTDMLIRQADLTVLTVKDYIAEPKPNGYRSLHVEHEIHYTYDRDVPDQVRKDLDTSGRTAAELAALMEDLHRQVHGEDGPGGPAPGGASTPSDATLETLRRIRGTRR